jgi:hypothetical protein
VRTFGGVSTANCKLAVKFGHHLHDSADSRGEALTTRHFGVTLRESELEAERGELMNTDAE